MAREMSESKKVNEAWINEALKDGLARGIACFDVRDYIMGKVSRAYPRNKEYQEGFNSENIFLKTAVGKKYACEKKTDYDYDTCLFTLAVFQKLMFPNEGEIIWKNDNQYKYNECRLKVNDVEYRGDTMNSWSTTVNRYINYFGNKHLNYLILTKSKIYGRPQEYPKWEDFLAVSENYRDDKPFPSYITDFMDIVYTIGNFIPLPNKSHQSKDTLNKKRGSCCGNSKDYWDLALLCFYNYYLEKEGKPKGNYPKCNLEWLFEKEELVSEAEEWLDIFETWDGFVTCNFMQPFVGLDSNGKYGEPKELWDKHFENVGKGKDSVLPSFLSEGQKSIEDNFKQFFNNATERILARGRRIGNALMKELNKEKV